MRPCPQFCKTSKEENKLDHVKLYKANDDVSSSDDSGISDHEDSMGQKNIANAEFLSDMPPMKKRRDVASESVGEQLQPTKPGPFRYYALKATRIGTMGTGENINHASAPPKKIVQALAPIGPRDRLDALLAASLLGAVAASQNQPNQVTDLVLNYKRTPVKKEIPPNVIINGQKHLVDEHPMPGINHLFETIHITTNRPRKSIFDPQTDKVAYIPPIDELEEYQELYSKYQICETLTPDNKQSASFSNQKRKFQTTHNESESKNLPNISPQLINVKTCDIKKQLKSNSTMKLIVNFYSPSKPQVIWGYGKTPILPGNKNVEQKTYLKENSLNYYTSTLNIKNFTKEDGGVFHVYLHNTNGSTFSFFDFGHNRLTHPVAKGPSFSILNESNFEVLCGVQLGNVEQGNYKTEWRLNNAALTTENRKHIETMQNHSSLPPGNYALLGVKNLAMFTRGDYSVLVSNDHETVEFKVNPLSAAEAPKITNGPFVATKYEIHEGSYMVGEVKLKIYYTACSSKHVLIWSTKGEVYLPGMEIGCFSETRKRIGPEKYVAILKFKLVCEDLNELEELEIKRMIKFRCQIMCVGGNSDCWISLTFLINSEEEEEENNEREANNDMPVAHPNEPNVVGAQNHWQYIPGVVDEEEEEEDDEEPF